MGAGLDSAAVTTLILPCCPLSLMSGVLVLVLLVVRGCCHCFLEWQRWVLSFFPALTEGGGCAVVVGAGVMVVVVAATKPNGEVEGAAPHKIKTVQFIILSNVISNLI